MHPSLGIAALLPRMCPGMFSNMLHWLTVERNPQAPPCHLESSKEKNERLITLITNEIHRLESSFIPTPYRKQKTSIQKRTPYRHYLSTNSNATFSFLWTLRRGRIVAISPVTCRSCFLMRLTGEKFFFGNKECLPTLSLSQIIPPIHRLLFPLLTVCPSTQKVKISSKVGRQNPFNYWNHQ